LSLATAAAIGIALSPIAAQAMLEEVIVTAQKREQSLQDVPLSVAAFSGEALRESGIKDVFDLQVNAPGLTIDQNQNATTSNFSIRGIGTGGNNFGQESSVGLYVDGIYRSRQSSMISQLVDMDSVEVLRGPQGTLFGRNTLSGAVQFKTAAPDFEGTGFLEATAGNYDLLNLSGAKSFTLVEDVLAVRLTGFSSERDGWIKNIAPANSDDDKIFDRDRWGWRAQALWTPTEELTVRVIIDDSELDEVCCGTTVTFDNNRPSAIDGTPGSDSLLADPANNATFRRSACSGNSAFMPIS
jgi:outer membrane receptor protein involved in Fe transport